MLQRLLMAGKGFWPCLHSGMHLMNARLLQLSRQVFAQGPAGRGVSVLGHAEPQVLGYQPS